MVLKWNLYVHCWCNTPITNFSSSSAGFMYNKFRFYLAMIVSPMFVISAFDYERFKKKKSPIRNNFRKIS